GRRRRSPPRRRPVPSEDSTTSSSASSDCRPSLPSPMSWSPVRRAGPATCPTSRGSRPSQGPPAERLERTFAPLPASLGSGERDRQEVWKMVQELDDPRRTEPPFVLGEREMLDAWLEFHRATLLLKCEGLDDRGRKSRPVSTSKLSLHGLVRHMAEVERNWFRRALLNEPSAPYFW